MFKIKINKFLGLYIIHRRISLIKTNLKRGRLGNVIADSIAIVRILIFILTGKLPNITQIELFAITRARSRMISRLKTSAR